MNITNDQVAEFLGNLSVINLISLTKELEKKWGVEAKPQVVTTIAPQPVENKESAQTEFNVSLISFPADKKITLIKLLREVTGLGLVESKSLIESLPKMVKEGASKEDAEMLKAKFAEVGAVVEVK